MKETEQESLLPKGCRWDDLLALDGGVDRLAFYRALLVHLGNEGSGRGPVLHAPAAVDERDAPRHRKRFDPARHALAHRSPLTRRALSEVGPLLAQFRQSVLRAAFSGRLTADWHAQRRMGIPVRPSNNEDSDKNVQATYEPATEFLSRIRTERRHRWEQSELAKYEAKGEQPPQKLIGQVRLTRSNKPPMRRIVDGAAK